MYALLLCGNSATKKNEMKKLLLSVMTFCLLLLLVPAQSNAATEPIPIIGDSIAVVETARVNALLARLGEISLIDRTTLRPPERKELRKEVRSIKKELRERGGGVYISGGALLIVIILLILLL